MNITFAKSARFVMRLIAEKIHNTKFSTPRFSCWIENSIASLFRSNVIFSFDSSTGTYCADESTGGKRRHFVNKQRGFWLYRKGIDARGDFLFSSYCLNNIKFFTNDVIIDCGANSGDLTLGLLKCSPKLHYVGIEPSPEDFAILKRNVHIENSVLINKALGEKNEELKFYVCTEEGDSSLVEPPSYTEIIKVEVVRLDDLIEELGIQRVKLLKLEAEGFEPEILNGAKGMLDKIEYIAVDGGYERGIEKEQTFTSITNFLLLNNFELVDIYFPWFRALYKKSG